MLYRAYLFIITVFVLPCLAAATTIISRDGNCNTGSLQCCQSTQQNSAVALAIISALLGISLPNISGLIGLSCSSGSVAGTGSQTCNAQPVCCTNTSFQNVQGVALGCTPVNV
ncbi:fungal hydrophobin-domain-containing protein [Panaeolus papilionaceus]|nr:fungal hydrophobin-domain-containing protein [Panaeolus papilionaceus]